MNDLKPCPFCGGGAELFSISEEFSGPGYSVSCAKCLAVYGPAFVYDIDYSIGKLEEQKLAQKKVIDGWNRRVDG